MEKTCNPPPPQMFEYFFYFMSWYVRRLQADFCKIPQAFISVIAFLHFTKSMSISSTDWDNHEIIFLIVLTTLWTSFSHWPWLHLDLVFPSGYDHTMTWWPWPFTFVSGCECLDITASGRQCCWWGEGAPSTPGLLQGSSSGHQTSGGGPATTSRR